MFNSIKALFRELLEGSDLSEQSTIQPELAIAALLCEVSAADSKVEVNEDDAKVALLIHLLKIEQDEALSLIAQAKQNIRESASLYDFTSQLRSLSQQERFELVKAMWEVAHADGHIDPMEDAVIRKVAELLYVDHIEFIRAKLSVIDR